MRKKFALATAAMVVGLGVCGLAACSKEPGVIPSDSSSAVELTAVAYDSISLSVLASQINLTWGSVENAEKYEVVCNDFTYVTSDNIINYEKVSGFTLPNDLHFDITIIAKADGYGDSVAVSYSATVEEYQLSSPKIDKYENGKISWGKVAGATGYSVYSDGNLVSEKQSGLEFDLSTLSGEGSHRIDVVAVSSNETYRPESSSASFIVSADKTELTLPAITDYAVKNGVLSWEANGSAKGYRIVDINRNVAATVTGSSYDMSDKVLVLAVYPVPRSDIFKSGTAMGEIPDIEYLEGEGTEQSPYIIKTPFDLRAIDYYESLYAEKLKTDPTAVANHYRIENDINYNSVPALEDASNIYTLSKPFYGTLDGNDKRLRNIRVRYDGGYWALFDFVTTGAMIKDIRFYEPDIYNETYVKGDDIYPYSTQIAMVAHDNYGTISGIVIKDARFEAMGGDVCGIASINRASGNIIGCQLTGSCEFIQTDTGVLSQACFEMAGVSIDNYGTISGCSYAALSIRGSQSSWSNDGGSGTYNNIRTVGGIVSYNRNGGEVTNNTCGMFDIVNALDNSREYSFGGIIADNMGRESGNSVERFRWSVTSSSGEEIVKDNGNSSKRLGKICGYNRS